MDKLEIRRRAQELYEDDLQFAIRRDDEIDVAQCRARAATRLGREMEGRDISGVWLGYIEGIARGCERGFEIDFAVGQIRIGGMLRTGPLRFIPADRARAKDVLEWNVMRDRKLSDFAAKREHERPLVREALERMYAFGGDPTLIEAWPDLFGAQAA